MQWRLFLPAPFEPSSVLQFADFSVFVDFVLSACLLSDLMTLNLSLYSKNFLVPSRPAGNDAMVGVFSSGTATNGPMLNHILNVDWLKNMMWAGQCLILASSTDSKTQKNCALAFMGMMAGACANLVLAPPSGKFELPPPVVMYIGIIFPLYTLAIMGAGKAKGN